MAKFHDSNLTLKIDTLNNALRESYTYDDLNRLTNTVRGGTNYQSWNLDLLGNMITTTNGSSNTSSTFNSQNELTSFGGSTLAFDNNGNTTTDEQGRTLTYDAWNRLLQVNDTTGAGGGMITSYAYDGMGHRVTETPQGANSTELYYSSQWQVVEEDIHASGLKTSARYVWSAGGAVYVNALIVRDYDFNGAGGFQMTERTYALQDANYDVTSLVTRPTTFGDANEDGVTDISDFTIVADFWQKHVSGGEADGDLNHDGIVDISDETIVTSNWTNSGGTFTWQVTERLAYDGYGKFTTTVKDNVGTWHNWGDYLAWNYTFQGGRFDVHTGLVQFQERPWDTIGRWVSPEPSYGTPYVDGPDLYPGFADNPSNRVDPTGLMVYHVQLGAEVTLGPGIGAALQFAWDDDGNSALVLLLSARGGANIGAGGEIGIAIGDIPDLIAPMLDGIAANGFDINAGAGLNGTLSIDRKTGKISGGAIDVGVGPDFLKVGISVGGDFPPIVLWKHLWPRLKMTCPIDTTQGMNEYTQQTHANPPGYQNFDWGALGF